MKNNTEPQDERILEAYLSEYRHLSASILASEEGRRHIVNLKVAVIAASISAVTILQSQPLLYLFGGILLSLLTWIMMEETTRTHFHNLYLRTVLGPKIEDLLHSHEKPAFEYTHWAFNFNTSTFSASVLGNAKYLIGIGMAALFTFFFYIARNPAKVQWTTTERIMFWANVAAILIPILLGVISISTLGLKQIVKSFMKNVLGRSGEGKPSDNAASRPASKPRAKSKKN